MGTAHVLFLKLAAVGASHQWLGACLFPLMMHWLELLEKMLSWKKTDGEKSRFLVLFVVLLTQSLYAVSPTLYSNVLVPSFFIKEKKKGKEKGGAGEGENVIVL